MLACLKLVRSGNQERVYEIGAEEILIGRKSDADVVLTDPYISRQHAKIRQDSDHYLVVDLDSTHGTFVNDTRIESQALKNGDRIRLGGVELLFSCEDSTQTPAAVRIDDLEKSLAQLSSVFSPSQYESYSDLKKISWVLDFQHQWGQQFSPDSTFEQILKSALKLSGAERGYVLMKRDDAFDYALGMARDGTVLRQSDFRTSQSVVRQVATSGQPIFMTEGIKDEFAQQDSIVAMNLRAAACLPLEGISSDSDDRDVLGILYLDSKNMMHALSGLDEKILGRLAMEAGNVIEKLEMIKSFQERKKFEEELAVAYETQKALLPHQLPEFGNFHICAFNEPTRYVGGDFYDFLQARPNQLLGILADVCGKGVSAALLSSLLQGALDMECRSGAPIDEVLNRINKFLCARSQPNRFVTLFFFSLGPDGRGEFVSAGHNPAYLFHAAEGEVEELHSGGLILGSFDFASYQSQPLELKPGDVLLVYSDGLTEAQNPEGEMFQEQRLLRLIRSNGSRGAAFLKQKILESLAEFTEGMAQTDDVTFLLVEAGGRSQA